MNGPGIKHETQTTLVRSSITKLPRSILMVHIAPTTTFLPPEIFFDPEDTTTILYSFIAISAESALFNRKISKVFPNS